MPPHSNLYEFKPNDTANEILLGNPTKTDLRSLHPPAAQIWELWQVFLANVNPLTHLIHAPTMEASLARVCEDMSCMSRGMEALMFAIYCTTVNSMSDNGCQSMFGETRDLLLVRYIFGCRHALSNSLWLRTSEIMILQAFTLFLVSNITRLYPLLTRLSPTDKLRSCGASTYLLGGDSGCSHHFNGISILPAFFFNVTC